MIDTRCANTRRHAIEGTAHELLAEAETEAGEGQGAKAAAEEFLRELLSAPTPATAVKSEARDAGHAWATIRRAAHDMNVIRRKGGMNAGWYWSLADGAQETPKVLTQKNEHLREEMGTFAAPDLKADGLQPEDEVL